MQIEDKFNKIILEYCYNNFLKSFNYYELKIPSNFYISFSSFEADLSLNKADKKDFYFSLDQLASEKYIKPIYEFGKIKTIYLTLKGVIFYEERFLLGEKIMTKLIIRMLELIKKIELNSEPLSTERIFKALLITNKCLEKDKERFNKPFLCLKDGLKFSNKFELDLHKKQNYTLESIKDEEIRRKFEIIGPLLEMGKLTHNVIDRRGKQFGVNRYTIYRWIRAFKQNGIDGLARNKCEKGKRSKRFSNEVYQIIEDKINAYDGQSLSMKKCWEDIKNDCIALGYEVSQIPTYEAIRKRIKQI